MSQETKPTQNPDYYAARAVEERRLAMTAKDSTVRAIHLELAERYAILARSRDLEVPQLIGEQQRA